MSAPVAHFAIHADDVGRARRFYEQALGWSFQAWGPPGFLQIDTGGEGLRGALQQRRDLEEGVRMCGYECTVAVDDVEAVKERVIAAGGRVLMDISTIAGVGRLFFFADTEGNHVGAMQYDASAE